MSDSESPELLVLLTPSAAAPSRADGYETGACGVIACEAPVHRLPEKSAMKGARALLGGQTGSHVLRLPSLGTTVPARVRAPNSGSPRSHRGRENPGRLGL